MGSIERRALQRYTMALPLTVRSNGDGTSAQIKAQTRDISPRGLYFFSDSPYEPGHAIELVLTLPKEITKADDLHIRCFGQVLRVEPQDARSGIAVRIERYEFLPKVA